MATFNYDGKAVSVNDRVTILGNVTAISGSTVTVRPLSQVATIDVNEKDTYGPQTDGSAKSLDGKGYAVADRVNVMGVVTSISGSTLTVTLNSSGNSVSVHSGSVRSVATV